MSHAALRSYTDWLASHTRAFAFFDGVRGAVVCDQRKSGVTTPCRYEPPPWEFGLLALLPPSSRRATTAAPVQFDSAGGDW